LLRDRAVFKGKYFTRRENFPFQIPQIVQNSWDAGPRKLSELVKSHLISLQGWHCRDVSSHLKEDQSDPLEHEVPHTVEENFVVTLCLCASEEEERNSSEPIRIGLEVLAGATSLFSDASSKSNSHLKEQISMLDWPAKQLGSLIFSFTSVDIWTRIDCPK
jgi:hypothetical protein